MENKLFLVVFIFTLLTFHGLCQEDTRAEDDVSFQVSIHLNYNDEFLCGGSIVSYNKILCPASCLYYNTWNGVIPPIVISIRTGIVDLNNPNFSGSSSYNAERITFHKDFDSTSMNYNFAVIEIDTRFPSNGQLLITKEVSSEYEHCRVTGWAKDSNILIQTNVALAECVETKAICVSEVNDNGQLCTHTLGSSLVCDGKLLGILSREPDCTKNNPLSFENVIYAMDMLKTNDTSASSSTSVKTVVTKITIPNMIWSMLVIFLIALVI